MGTRDVGFVDQGPLENNNEMILLDEENPRSVINLVTETVAIHIQNVPSSMLDIGEDELRTLYGINWKPPTIDDRLRFMFWKEYDNAQSNIRKMKVSHIYAGVCSRECFYKVIATPERFAWILCPPVDYMVGAEEALTYGLEQLRDILTQRHTTMGGALDSKSAALKLEVVKMLDQRVKGAIIQTTKNLNVNVNANKGIVAPKIEDVDKRIKELEDQLKNMNEAAPAITLMDIEVESTEV